MRSPAGSRDLRQLLNVSLSPITWYASPMTRNVCVVEDCSSFVTGRGWCHFHYYRWKRWGDPEAAGRTCTCEKCGSTWIRSSKGGRPDFLCSGCKENYAKCSMCKEIKSLGFFFVEKNGRASSRCKSCSAQYTRARLASLSETERTATVRESNLLRKYGLTIGQWQEMFEAQEGRCKICGDESKLVVDHCHTEGHVRSLLCSPCNMGLGHFRDDPVRLSAAIEYLYTSKVQAI